MDFIKEINDYYDREKATIDKLDWKELNTAMFYDAVGLDYVSCSPFRVPLARLAAAQANIVHEREKGKK